MSLYDKYELLEVERDGAVKTFRARQIATGRVVSTHLLLGSVSGAVLDAARQVSASAGTEIMEIGEHEGTAYVVTPAWSRPEGFAEWVLAAGASQNDLKKDPGSIAKAVSWRVPTEAFKSKTAEPPPRPPAEPGEFTRMFQSPARPGLGDAGPLTQVFARPLATPPIPEPGSPEPVPQPLPDEPTPPTPPVLERSASALDEFDKLFGLAPRSSAFKTPARESENPVEASGAATEPGEFTRMFQLPATSPQRAATAAPGTAGPVAALGSTPASAASGGTPEPGEFTRMFQLPVSQPPNEGSRIPAAPPELPQVYEQSGESEFTRYFKSPHDSPVARPHPKMNETAAARPSVPPSDVTDAPGEFTRIFGTPSSNGHGQPISSAQAGGSGATVASAAPSRRSAKASQSIPQAGTPLPMSQLPHQPAMQSGTGAQGAGQHARVESEFARIFTVPSAAPAIQPSGRATFTSAAQNTGKKTAGTKYLRLLIGFGVVFLIAVIVGIAFALRQ